MSMLITRKHLASILAANNGGQKEPVREHTKRNGVFKLPRTEKITKKYKIPPKKRKSAVKITLKSGRDILIETCNAPATVHAYTSQCLDELSTKALSEQKIIDTSENVLSEQFRPQSVHPDEFIGHTQVIKTCRKWICNVINADSNTKRILLLYGRPGVGKTTLAHIIPQFAPAHVKFSVVELNASCQNTYNSIKRTLRQNCATLPLPGFPQAMPVIDELDGVFDVSSHDFDNSKHDLKPAVNAIIEFSHKFNVPIVCIANDKYAQAIRPLLPHCEQICMAKLPHWLMEKHLKRIQYQRGKHISSVELNKIVKMSQGDMRSAINQLELGLLSEKDTTPNIFDITSTCLSNKQYTIRSSKAAVAVQYIDAHDILFMFHANDDSFPGDFYGDLDIFIHKSFTHIYEDAVQIYLSESFALFGSNSNSRLNGRSMQAPDNFIQQSKQRSTRKAIWATQEKIRSHRLSPCDLAFLNISDSGECEIRSDLPTHRVEEKLVLRSKRLK